MLEQLFVSAYIRMWENRPRTLILYFENYNSKYWMYFASRVGQYYDIIMVFKCHNNWYWREIFSIRNIFCTKLSLITWLFKICKFMSSPQNFIHYYFTILVLKLYLDNIDYRNNYSYDISWHEILVIINPCLLLLWHNTLNQVCENWLYLHILYLKNTNLKYWMHSASSCGIIQSRQIYYINSVVI